MLKVNDLEMVFSAGSVQLDFPEVRGNLQVVRDLCGLVFRGDLLPRMATSMVFLSPIGLDITPLSTVIILCIYI